MKGSDAPRAAELAGRRSELVKRLGCFSKEDRGWQQSLSTSDFHVAAERIGEAIEAHLRGEPLLVEQELRQLDVKIDE